MTVDEIVIRSKIYLQRQGQLNTILQLLFFEQLISAEIITSEIMTNTFKNLLISNNLEQTERKYLWIFIHDKRRKSNFDDASGGMKFPYSKIIYFIL